MDPFLKQVLDIPTTPPGNLTYHLVLAFSVAGALQASFNHWRNSRFPQSRRMVAGLALLLLARLVLIFAAGLTEFFVLPDALLPILDRSVTALGLVLIIWLWVFPESLRLADTASLLLALLVLTLAVFSVAWWENNGGGSLFNGTLPDQAWEGFDLFLIIAGTLMLLVRRPNGYSFGLGMFALLFAGHLGHFLVPIPDSNYPGAVRLAELAAYPLLLALPQRFPLPAAAQEPALQAPKNLIPERKRYGIELDLFRSLLSIAAGEDPKHACESIAYAVSRGMLADLCLIISPPDAAGEMSILCGYNLIREETVDGALLESRTVPLLSEALRRGANLRLPASSTSRDVSELNRILTLPSSGPLLAIPFQTPWERANMGIVLLSPYSKRSWTATDEDYLVAIANALSRVLASSGAPVAAAESQTEDLLQQITLLQEQVAQERDRAESLVELVSANESAQGTIASLQKEKDHLAAVLLDLENNSSSKSNAQAGELRLALGELADLRGQLAEAEERIHSLEQSKAELIVSMEQGEDITAIAQELRQPLSSILGYTDLLLGESMGILGTLQRKFLDRIRASTQRMDQLIQDLLKTTASNTVRSAEAGETAGLAGALDTALKKTSADRAKKEISLRKELPSQALEAYTGREALEEIFSGLLRYVGSLTATGGAIDVVGRLESDTEMGDFLLLEVSSIGGAIPLEDLNAIFSGDPASRGSLDGLSGDLFYARDHIETLGGRMWVDSGSEAGFTLSLLLPVLVLSEVPGRGEPAG